MPKIPESFNFGTNDNLKLEELVIKLERMYYDLAKAVNMKPDVYVREDDALGTETFMSIGSININTSTNKVEMITDHPTQTTVTWVTLS